MAPLETVVRVRACAPLDPEDGILSRIDRPAATESPSDVRRRSGLLRRLEAWLPVAPPAVDWHRAAAGMWRRTPLGGRVIGGSSGVDVSLADLVGIDDQKARVVGNVRQFLAGLPANHMLFWGARGAGKSSLVHAVLGAHVDQGLRLLEVDRDDLVQLPDIAAALAPLPWRFLIYCDDLSFEAGESQYKALKRALDGSVFTSAPNLLICATSNRRHLLPEPSADNAVSRIVDGELHPGEGVEERIALSDRFGLWIPFHPLPQRTYLEIVAHWVAHYRRRHGVVPDPDHDVPAGLAGEPGRSPTERAALQWALTRGHRSGRTANHFARHWVAQEALQSGRFTPTETPS